MWAKYFSCHKCRRSSEIPFLAVEMQAIDEPIPDNFRRYTLSELRRNRNENSSLKNIECLEDNLESLGYDQNDNTDVENYNPLPNNCALGVINLSVTNGNSKLNQTV